MVSAIMQLENYSSQNFKAKKQPGFKYQRSTNMLSEHNPEVDNPPKPLKHQHHIAVT
jgi:hypothetical protein